MTTLSGIPSKGEKGRPRFQSLDINSLYRGESLEPSQQKNTLPRRHGMQCLGKVPSARRPPANLPSLKSEHSGNDPAVSLVPSGGTGWGNKPGETAGPAATTPQPHTTPPATNIPVVAPQPPVVAPVMPSAVIATPSTANPPAQNQGPPPVMQQTVHSDKLWSSVMANPGEGVHPPSFLAHQSPQFQQEFPKLSSGDGQAPATGQKGGSDTQYGPGPSLRPQTEGSWIQGGGRNAGQPPGPMPTGGATGSHQGAAVVPGPLPLIQPGSDPTGGRNNLGPYVAPVGGMGPGGPVTQVPNTGATNALPGGAPGGNMMPPHLAPNTQQQFSRNIMSQFQMYRGAFSPNFQAPMHGPGPVRPSRYQHPTENRFVARPTPNTVDDELVPRPIIKEEDLSKMDDIARDAGWAIHDDDIVDYNQQLLFSDDESTPDEEARKDAKAGSKDEKRSSERERENERESMERDEHREDHRDKRNEPLLQRGPPEQPGRNWQPGRSSVNMDFRNPAGHGPVTPPAHPLPHGGPGPAPLDCPIPPVMRPVSHQGQDPGPHVVEDEEIWTERRRQQNAEVALAIERAKLRKEEEEKRFQGTKQGAARKLQALEQKMKLAAEKEHHEENSAPGPDWEKDKDRDNRERDRSLTNSEGREEKGAREGREIIEHRERDSDFRQIPQNGERPGFLRERDLPRNERDRDLPRNERDRDFPRSEREREIPRNERERDMSRSEKDRDLSRNDRDRNEREREVSRNERDRGDRDREIPRSDREREMSRNEREREIPRDRDERQRSEREREIPRDRDERPRNDREREIPRIDREISRNERDREITRIDRERDISCNEREIPRIDRDRDNARSGRDREITRNERERERNDRDGSRNEREREVPRCERDMRSERDRDRDIRSDRDRKPRDSRGHDSHFLANLPPRFQRSGLERSVGFYGGQGSQTVPPPPAVGTGPAQGPPPPPPPQASQGAFPPGSASSQTFDPRWNAPHFPSGPLSASGSTSNNLKSSYMLPRSRNTDGDALNSDRERDRERERNEREREREIEERERERERPPSRGIRERRDRHINDISERYRPNTRERDMRSYPESANNTRKPSGNYYEGLSEYGRSYSRGSQEYDRNEYSRGREREPEIDSRSSETRERDSRLGNRDREGRHYDDRRDGDLMDDVYDRLPPSQQSQFEDHKRDGVRDLNRQDSSNDWREKDRKILEDREKLERRDGDGRREREERPQRPDSRDSRTSRESRNSRDSVREERSVHDNDHKHILSNREVTGSWVEDHYPDIKEEKKKSDFFREDRRDVRHPPGPITREKLEAAELRNDSKRNLTPLKRSTSMNSNEKKQDVRKIDLQACVEKSDRKPNEADVWNRSAISKTLERTTPENTVAQTRFPDQPTCKPWVDQIPQDDAVSQNVAVSEDKPSVPIDSNKKDMEKEVSNNVPAEAPEKVKSNPKEVEVDGERQDEVKKEDVMGPVDVEPKREKSSRSRSRGARGRSDGRANRQGSGSYAVYRGGAMSWGQQRERGRRGLHRPPPSRASNAGEYTQATESEQSDEASAESSKEDASRGTGGQRRPERERESRRPPRSPKQGQKKAEKEEKNRESRRGDGEKGFGNSDPHRYDKRSAGYDAVRNSGREGFAPVGEPSRRGRGGAFRRGSAGRRYGPPSSKSPFGQPQEDGKHPPGNDDPKSKNCDGASDPSKEDLGGELVSNEDKNKLKLQALTAGVIGSGARQYGGGGKQSTQVPPRMQGKSETDQRDSSRSKSRRGGSSGRGPSHLQGRADRSANIASGSGGVGAKQNSSDVAEDWETTSEHSEGEDHDEGNRSGRKAFVKRDGRRSRGLGNSRAARGVTSNATSPSGRNTRSGIEKRSNGSTSNGFPSGSGQRVSNCNISGSNGAPQANGRTPNSRNNNQVLPLPAKVAGKENIASVNRMDEMKINDPGLVNQAINDLSMTKKNIRLEKDKTNALEGIDLNNFASVVVVDDQPGVTLEEERFTFDDADSGFQEVRNKKKEARQKDDQKVQQQLPSQQQSLQQTQQNTSQQQSQPQTQQQQQQQQQPTSQTPQQTQVASQQQPLPQRSTLGRDKELSVRQKGNKQSSSGGGGQIPSPIPGATQQLLQAPIPQIPVPQNMSQQGLAGGNTKPFDRQRNKLPPRLAKQRETSRIQKQQQHQHQQQYVASDVSEMNKINQSVSMFPMKDSPNPAPPPAVNAWEKPINAALRPNSPSGNAGGSAIQISGSMANSAENCSLEVNEQVPSGTSSQRSTPSGDKVSGKLGREVAEKAVLDGTSPPVQTIIFENTNYKSGPSELSMKAKFSNHLKNSRIDKGRERKLGEDVEDVQLSFANKNSGPVPEMNKPSENKTDPIQMPIAFNKNEDGVDMKLDFTFDSELSQLTDDKKNKSMGLPRSMHLPQGVQSTISHGSTDELNFKIASVKKVWEIIPPGPPVMEHNEDGSVASTASSFTPSFGNPVDSGLDTSFSKGVDGSSVTGDDGSSLNPGEVVYSSGPQIQNNPNSYSGNIAVSAVPNMVKNDVPSTSSNVCKVKPQQQAVMSAGPSPIGHPGPLSPPPFNSSNTQQGHINYQPTLGGTAAQFGSISAIPSPPTVLSYSSQQIASQGGLYGAFQLDGTQVLSGQARSQFSGFPPYGLNQGLAGQTSAFNQQSMYLPTAPHPPPSAAPDLYSSSLSQYRIPAAQGPFGQSQQLSSNPSTVLISSTSNSLMSASVKPSSQQIGAIGTKGGGPYQQSGLPSAPQPSQLFIQYDPNYLSGSQMVQRPGPVQSNVVPTIPHSSSFYSGSAGGQAGYYQATNSTLQQGPSGQPLHQTGSPYSLQGYSTQSGTATPVGLQGFSSPMAQYRGTSLPGHTFLKSGSQHPTDHSTGSNGRTQLKSPSSSQQDVLASVSVFSSGPQIPSPKSRNSKQQGPQQQQQSPNQQQPSQQNQQQPPHHKFSPYQGMAQSTQLAFQQGVRGQMNIPVRGGVPSSTQRYPQPIQRPVPFPGGGAQGANAMGGRHRPQHQQPSRQPANVNKPGNNQPYYSHGSNVKMETASDGKPESAGETKIPENVAVTGSNSTAPGSSKPVTSVASQPEHKIPPAENGKEESAAPAAE